MDSGGPAINARAYARLIATGEIDRHLRRTRREYRERRDALVAALTEQLPRCRVDGVAAGLHLLLRLPPRTDEDAVVAELAARRIRVNGLNAYRLAPKDEPALVIGYGRLPRPAIAGAVSALAAAI